jgi:hypothetical protein
MCGVWRVAVMQGLTMMHTQNIARIFQAKLACHCHLHFCFAVP